MSSENKERNIGVNFLQSGKKIEGRAVRKHVICDNNVRSSSPKDLLRILATLRFVNVVSLKLKKVSNPESQTWLIVNDKYPISSHRWCPLERAVGIWLSYMRLHCRYCRQLACLRALP